MPKITQERHIRPPPFYPKKCLTNSGCYILSQGTEENSNAICSLSVTFFVLCSSGTVYPAKKFSKSEINTKSYDSGMCDTPSEKQEVYLYDKLDEIP